MICITDTSLRHGGGYTTLCVYLFRKANCGVNCVYNSYSLQCFSLSLWLQAVGQNGESCVKGFQCCSNSCGWTKFKA